MEEKKKSLNGAGFYAVLGLLLVTLGLGGWALYETRTPEAELPEPLPEVTDPVRQPEADPRPRPTAQPVTPPAPQPEERPEPVQPTAAGAELPAEPEEGAEMAAETAAEPEPEGPTLIVYPVSGQVQAAFSAQELQYSPTLGDWRTHDGIDLGAKPGTTVLSACAGTVLSVEQDPLMGTTVRVSHAGDYETVYANLQSQPPVSAGDEVSAGQIIGAVGETALAEQSQPPHLHFSVLKAGTAIDPEGFLNP